MSTYLDDTATTIRAELPAEIDCPAGLLRLYALLLHVKGAAVTAEDVHDAWAVWTQEAQGEHRSLVPFDHLHPDVQAMDEPFVEAIRRAAATRRERDGDLSRLRDSTTVLPPRRPTSGLWRNQEGTREGKYLVLRRDGTVPEWPYFVIGARDPAAVDALLAYVGAALREGMDQRYASDVCDLAEEFAAYRRERGRGDPDAVRHRVDDPTIVARMAEGHGGVRLAVFRSAVVIISVCSLLLGAMVAVHRFEFDIAAMAMVTVGLLLYAAWPVVSDWREHRRTVPDRSVVYWHPEHGDSDEVEEAQ